MNRSLIVRPEAGADIQETRNSLELLRAGLGEQFLSRLRQVLERIEAMPEIYGVVWQDVRAARLKQFRHVVYYVVSEDRVEVLAVLHGSRSEAAWQSRV